VQNRRRPSSSGVPARAARAIVTLHVIVPEKIWPAFVPFELYLTLRERKPARNPGTAHLQLHAHGAPPE